VNQNFLDLDSVEYVRRMFPVSLVFFVPITTGSVHAGRFRTTRWSVVCHCFALALLGSYLTDAYNGDIRCRSEVSGHLAHDVRQGSHARQVMDARLTKRRLQLC
jgi:hypothetical protein